MSKCPRCPKCNAKITLMYFLCQGCNEHFCIKCRLPEDHLCNYIDESKKKYTISLSNKLYNETTKDTHRLLKNI